MIKYENDCVGCDYCVSCGRKHTPYFYCDNCGEAVETLRNYDGEQWCDDCILEEFEIIESEDII